MRLLHDPAAPFARKVMVTLHETGQFGRVELVPAAGAATALSAMSLAVNPLGKLPTLERDDGPALYDSRVICRYLDDLGQGGLYPAAPRLWETLTLEATGDGIVEAARLCQGEQDEGWSEAEWGTVGRVLDALEARWLSHLAGRIDAGQIAVGCALGYLDLRLGVRGWREGRPGVAAWFERFGERPSMLATRTAG
jgi:glutathione S-transferase